MYITIPGNVSRLKNIFETPGQNKESQSSNSTNGINLELTAVSNNYKNQPVSSAPKENTLSSSLPRKKSFGLEVEFKSVKNIRKQLDEGLFAEQFSVNTVQIKKLDGQYLHNVSHCNVSAPKPEDNSPPHEVQSLLFLNEKKPLGLDYVNIRDDQTATQIQISKKTTHLPLNITSERLEEYKSATRDLVRYLREGQTKNELKYFMRCPVVSQKNWAYARFCSTNKIIGSWQRFKDANLFTKETKTNLASLLQSAFIEGRKQNNTQAKDIDGLIEEIKKTVSSARGDKKMEIACSIAKLQGMLSAITPVKTLAIG